MGWTWRWRGEKERMGWQAGRVSRSGARRVGVVVVWVCMWAVW